MTRNERCPIVAEPDGRQQVQLCRFGPTIPCGYLNENVVRIGFGIFHKNVEIVVSVKDCSIKQLILEVVARTLTIDLYEISIRIGRLGILVEIFHVGVSRRAVEVEVVLLNVFSMVSLAIGQAKQTLLEDRILTVPQSEGEAQALLVV